MKLHPAYLWIGSQEILKIKISEFIKKIICKNQGCNNCFNCSGIDKEQHYLIRFLKPENQYTVAQIDEIIESISFKLNEEEHFFFILERADLLSVACANRLLKSLEEPPRGYHFILLSPHREGILPTVSSRCLIQQFQVEEHIESPLFKYFSVNSNQDYVAFYKEINQKKFSESEVLSLVGQVYDYWLNIYKKAFVENDKNLKLRSEKVLKILEVAQDFPPMPGSSKLFLKNLFIQFVLL